MTGGFVRRNATWDGQDLVSSLFTRHHDLHGLHARRHPDPPQARRPRSSAPRTCSTSRSPRRRFGPFGVRAGYSQIEQDLIVTPDPSEIVVPGGQGGNFDRTIDRVEGALTFGAGPFFVAAEASWDDADKAVLRTDYLDPQPRARARHVEGLLVAHGRRDRALDRPEERRRSASTPKGSSRQYTADVTLTPVKVAHGSTAPTARCRPTTRFPIRAPQDFTAFDSVNTEDGELWEAGLGLNFDRIAIDGFWTRFANEGTYAYRLYRGGARVDFDATANLGFIGEWAVDRYLDYQIASSNFRANRIGVYLKWRP